MNNIDMLIDQLTAKTQPTIVQISTDKLHPFPAHPFKVQDDEDMEQLTQSIQAQGVLTPLVIRPLDNGEYEVISGHRRLHACRKAGIQTVPALIYAIDRDAAAIALVDSNLHRERILPSEKAFAYKLKMDALSKQGKRIDLTSDQVGPKLTAATLSSDDNVMNEMYARDISRKVRSSHRLRGNAGEPLSQPPYGYLKSPENKKKWVVDAYAADVVRNIFRMCLEGKGQETIARILQERKVLIPMAYWYSLGLKRGGKRVQPDPYKWSKSSIAKILANQEYCGDIINFKTYSKSFKNKTRLENPEENWVIFKNVHEPIIDRETYEQVQKMVGKTKRRAPKAENGEKNMFADLLYCANCGSKLWYHINTINRDIHFFSCSNYKSDTRGTCETRHYIRADAIEQVVMWELQRMAAFLRSDENAFAELLAQKTNADMIAEKKYMETELQRCIARNNKVAELFEKLYEDNVEGKVTDEWFLQLSHKYEVERMELKEKIAELRGSISDLDSMQTNKDQFIHAIRKFMEMQTLTAPLLRELIDHIDVYETEGTGKNRTQRIIIHYKFVGVIEIPDSGDNYTADTRKGVSVEYVTKSA